MNARGFDSEHDARQFATKLKSACELSSVAARLGVDVGVDAPTSGFGSMVKDRIREQSGILLRNNIHGLDVFPDDPNVRIVSLNATGSVLAGPDPFLADLSIFYEYVDSTSQIMRDIVLLLNYALMRPEPVAQIVFAFSAVEMLGQNEAWSPNQELLLTELADRAEKSGVGSVNERREVADAIKRGTYKLSLRQGVLRLLASLGLEHLKGGWDALYSERSKLVHGLAPKPGADYGELSERVLSLCGQILLKAVSREVAVANAHVAEFYP